MDEMRSQCEEKSICFDGESRERRWLMSRYTGRGKRRSRVLPVLTLAAAVAAVILLTVAAKGVAL